MRPRSLGVTAMNIMPQTLNKLRARLDRDMVASPFSSLPEYKSIKHHQNLGALLGIENPFFRSTEGPQGRHTLIDGKPVLNFAWCDYLGLSKHPDLIAASKAAIDAYGTSVSASRMVSGDTPLHRELEQEIARTIGVEGALVFVSGHAANVSTIGTIMSADDLIVHDEFVHNSAVVGMRLSGAKTMTFRHNNLEALEKILREERIKYKNALVVIEGLYSTEGDIPDLARVVELKERYGAWLMVDDAHGCGVLGKTGAGLAEHCGVPGAKVDIWMGTLSKAYASCGGYIAGNRELIDTLRYSAPGFVFSVGLPPSMTAAALTALRVVKREPQRVKKLHENGALFLREAKARGLDTGRSIGIGMLPIMVGSTTRAAKAVSQVLERGINTSLIMSPGVPVNAARLRFFLSCEFTPEEITHALDVAKDVLAR
ncbi:MAG: aminotransferase class I/II-fold pyridoxal phosphate-dependent enzyme [Hyphomicrobium sp.]|nr:MAG: aminotransferase class I/II-fold pyridoxal phosphate-dependent enzyme [Hyphomicrobium sp.]